MAHLNLGETLSGPEMRESSNIFSSGGETPDDKYEAGVLKWVTERVSEGEALLKDEPAYEEIDKSISYIMGDQMSRSRPDALANCPDNRLKNILNQTVAALTDIHPLFGFKTYNPKFKDTEDVLMKLSQSWWTNSFADLRLADVIKFAAGVGTGYAEIVWDASAYNGTGDIVLRSIDPRDVLPIKPVLNGPLQEWEGVILRTAKSPDELRVRFPDKSHRIKADNTPSVFARSWHRARKAVTQVISPTAVDILTGNTGRNSPRQVPTCDVFTVYVKDRRLHIGPEPIIMGDPHTTWCYTVYPTGYDKVPNGQDSMGQPIYRKATVQDSKLYPRGRMIISTRDAVLYDGPNPYWHGMFPVAKLSLDPWPWSLLGLGLVHDIIPIQDAFNEMLNGTLDHMRQLLRPGIVADKKAVPESIWQRIDTRLPGMRLKTNAVAGKGVEFVTPEPLPAYMFEMIKFMAEEMDYHAGTGAMNALMSLQQQPGADSIEKMQEALTPTLRLKGRLLEYFLRDVGEMVKGCFFQFYNLPRRVSILGEAGTTFADFDFDPGSLVPGMSPDDDGYVPELDKYRSRSDRAQWYHKNFTFTVTPNSLLAISQISRKLMYLQLRQMQLVDRWTLYDVLEVPNGGTPPGGEETITDRLMAEMQLQAMQMMAMAPAGMGAPADGGPGGPVGENGQAGPGRPDSFQSPPTLLNKKDEVGAQRQTISTSGSGGG